MPYIVIGVSVTLYGAACATTALAFRNTVRGPDDMTGLNLLLIGWLGPFVGQFAWFANLLYANSLRHLLGKRWRRTAVYAGLACLLGLQTVQLFWQEVPADEGNVAQLQLVGLGVGFFAWQAAMLVVLAGAVIADRSGPREVVFPPGEEKQGN